MPIHILSLRSLHTQRADLVGDAAYATKALFNDFTAQTIHDQLVRQRLQLILQLLAHGHAERGDLRMLISLGDLQKVILLELGIE